jgi:hypothetical protein
MRSNSAFGLSRFLYEGTKLRFYSSRFGAEGGDKKKIRDCRFLPVFSK